MAVALITCDRCDCEITRDRTLIRVESGPLRDRYPSADLCVSCSESLSVWLASPEPAPDGPAAGRLN